MTKTEASAVLQTALDKFVEEENPAAHLVRNRLDSLIGHVEENWDRKIGTVLVELTVEEAGLIDGRRALDKQAAQLAAAAPSAPDLKP